MKTASIANPFPKLLLGALLLGMSTPQVAQGGKSNPFVSRVMMDQARVQYQDPKTGEVLVLALCAPSENAAIDKINALQRSKETWEKRDPLLAVGGAIPGFALFYVWGPGALVSVAGFYATTKFIQRKVNQAGNQIAQHKKELNIAVRPKLVQIVKTTTMGNNKKDKPVVTTEYAYVVPPSYPGENLDALESYTQGGKTVAVSVEPYSGAPLQ